MFNIIRWFKDGADSKLLPSAVHPGFIQEAHNSNFGFDSSCYELPITAFLILLK
jgi:hypothetical protein